MLVLLKAVFASGGDIFAFQSTVHAYCELLCTRCLRLLDMDFTTNSELSGPIRLSHACMQLHICFYACHCSNATKRMKLTCVSTYATTKTTILIYTPPAIGIQVCRWTPMVHRSEHPSRKPSVALGKHHATARAQCLYSLELKGARMLAVADFVHRQLFIESTYFFKVFAWILW